MALETVTLVKDLNPANPAAGDNKSEGDDHIRNIKKALKNQFPNLEAAVTRTAAQLNQNSVAVDAPVYRSVSAGNPTFQWLRPTFVSYSAFVNSVNNRWTLSQVDTAGAGIKELMSMGTNGHLEVTNSLGVLGSISTPVLVVSGSYIHMTQPGLQPRYLHRNGELMGILNTSGNWSMYSQNDGTLVAVGDVVAYSDEKLKKHWKKLPKDLLVKFLEVKVGTYTRKDTGRRQAGVSAQDMRKVLPEVVNEQDGTLGVAYGQAALVLLHELTKEVFALRARVAQLEGR